MQLSNKQKQLLQEIEKCIEDNKGTDDDYMQRLAAHGIPKIFEPYNSHITLSYEDYIETCKIKRAIILQNLYDLQPFNEAMEEISNNEIILYRSQLENRLQDGLHALMEIQFLDTLVILRKETNNQKLAFDFELKNIMFLMKNLVSLFELDPPTVANEYYEKEQLKASNDFNTDLRYKSPEDLDYIMQTIKLKSLSLALAMQHKCLIDNKSTKKGNILKYFKLFYLLFRMSGERSQNIQSKHYYIKTV